MDTPQPHYLQAELYERVKTDPEVFEFFQNAALDGLWYWDLESPENEWMNEDFWRLFGVDPSTKAHKAAEWQDIIHPEDLKVALENFERHIADPAYPYDQIVRYRHAEGHLVTVRCRGMAIRDATGKPLRMLGAHSDMSSLRRAQEDLATAHALTEIQDAFLSTVGHEIRTPLNAISGFFQLLSNADIGERQRDWAAKGLEATQNLNRTLQMIMDAAHLRDSAPKLNPEETYFEDLATYTKAVLEGGVFAAQRQVAVSVSEAPGLPETLQVDVLKLHQIMNNLIDNAIKFTPSGRIDVRFTVGDAEDHWKFILEDSGIGLAASKEADIFSTFKQGQGGINRPYGGAGLGLSISRGLATLMGGTLSLEERAQGVRAVLSLPIVSPT
ncbi:MAG: ATP-binding protein [Pseudomonadota bacterium]